MRLPRPDNTPKIYVAGNKPPRVLQHITFPVEINGTHIWHRCLLVQSLFLDLLAGSDFMAPLRFDFAYQDDGNVIRVANAAPCTQCHEIPANTLLQGPKQPAAPVGETENGRC